MPKTSVRISGRRILAGCVAGAMLMSAGSASAQMIPDIRASATFVTDYRYRGVSLSNRDPAVQASIELEASSFFVGAWGSSIADFNGATSEIELYGGWRGDFGLLQAEAGITGHLFPGGTDTDMVELFGSLAGSLGPATATVGLNWAPDQGNLAGSSRYAYASLSTGIPMTPLTAKASIGHERGSMVEDASWRGTTSKTDWMLGVDAIVGPLTLGVAYIGNDLPEKRHFNRTAKNAFVVSLGAVF